MSKCLSVKYLLISKNQGAEIKPFKILIFVEFIWGFPGGGVPSNYVQVFVFLIYCDMKKVEF